MNRAHSQLISQFCVLNRVLIIQNQLKSCPVIHGKSRRAYQTLSNSVVLQRMLSSPVSRNERSPWVLRPDSVRSFGSKNTNNRPQNKELAESSLLVQEGTEFQEVPLAILRTDLSKQDSKVPPKPFISLDPREEAAFVEGFSKFQSPQEVLEILDTIPSQEVTPVVAVSILRKLFELESNFEFRNDGRSWVISSSENPSIETFARTAIVARLVDIVILGDEPSVLLDALDILRIDRKGHGHQLDDPDGIYIESDEDYREEFDHTDRIQEFSNYRGKLCDEILIRTSLGKLSLDQVCRSVCSMGQMEAQFPFEVQPDFIDKMWIGILDKSDRIDLDNVLHIFRTLQYFKKSRRLVMNLVERKCFTLWWRMDPEMVAEICELLVTKEVGVRPKKQYWGSISTRLLSCLSRAISLNLHKVTEENLLSVLKTFSVLNFCDSAIEKALSKYMKAKSRNIRDPNLISRTMDYVKKFRLRSALILDGVAEWVVLHGDDLSGCQLTSILEPFGLLDYQPPNGIKFWDILERTLQSRFVQLPPKDVIELLLSCVYLQKYPLNFVDRVFSPYFLDRLHTSEREINLLQQIRSRLKLLDTALCLECGSKYNGPYLPKDFTARTVYTDGRIPRMANTLLQPLSSLFKKSNIETSIVLPNLPLNELYIVDLVISHASKSEDSEPEDLDSLELNHIQSQTMIRNHVGLRKDRRHFVPISLTPGNQLIAVLINIPEHFSSEGRHLIGPQVMRNRHLKLLGCTVVNLSYERLAELHVTPKALLDYLQSCFSKAKVM